MIPVDLKGPDYIDVHMGGILKIFDPTVPAWAKQPEKPSYTADEVGALSKDELQAGVNSALAQAKASGEFDGEPGHTPVRGKDYWTPEDKAEIVGETAEIVKESAGDFGAVLYIAQNLTDTQKAQARSNISAASEIVTSAFGENITLTDASDQPLHGLQVFGKSTQNGTPTPDAPVPIVSVGESGSVSVNITAEGKPNQTITITVTRELRSIGSVADEVDYARGVYVQRIKSIVLDKSNLDTWSSGTANAPYRASIEDVAKCTNDDSMLFCDKYPVKTINDSWAKSDFLVSRDSTTSPSVVFRNVNISSMSEWKQHVSNNPITVYYITNRPIETPLTEDELTAYRNAHTYKPNTTVYNDGGAEMEVSYTADTKTYIDNKFAALSAAILNNA